MPHPQLLLQTIRVGTSAVVRAEGEIDLATYGRLANGLPCRVPRGATLTLDLTAVTFMDVRGLHVLGLARALAAEGGELLVLPSPSVRLVCESLGCGAVLDVAGDHPWLRAPPPPVTCRLD